MRSRRPWRPGRHPDGEPSTGLAGLAFLDDDGDDPLSRTFRIRVATETDVAQAVSRLELLDSVDVGEPTRFREILGTPSDPRDGEQWGLAKINAPAAWDVQTDKPSIVVAVIDTGADLDRPDLLSNLVPGYAMVDRGPNPPAPKPKWVCEGDFAGRDATPEHEVGRSTHLAGTIAAVSNSAAGAAGVTRSCRLMPRR